MSGFQILIAGHAVIDEIIDYLGASVRHSLGGPVSYSSIALKQLGYYPSVATKIGPNFPKEYIKMLLDYGGVDLSQCMVPGSKTTSYRIDRSKEPRLLWLLAACEPLSFEELTASHNEAEETSLVVNTVANEISMSTLKELCRRFKFTAIDSQGFLRRFDSNGMVKLASGSDFTENLSGVDLLKADYEELCAWAGTTKKEFALEKVVKQIGMLLLTSGDGPVELYVDGRLTFRADPPSVRVRDTTGCGDILLSVFVAEMQKGLDRALRFSIASGSLAAEKTGVEKAILDRRAVENLLQSIDVEKF